MLSRLVHDVGVFLRNSQEKFITRNQKAKNDKYYEGVPNCETIALIVVIRMEYGYRDRVLHLMQYLFMSEIES